MYLTTIGCRVPAPRRGTVPIAACAVALSLLFLGGCGHGGTFPPEPESAPAPETPESGEQLLADALDELGAIADWSYSGSALALGKTEGDSVFVYGAVTGEGLGVVVTERHTHPKGLLLITVRRSYGTPGRIVSDVKRYDSYEGFRAGTPQQSTVTEVRPSSRDTIVTYVLRNGITETYTFRLPVVTRVTNLTAGTVRVTSRYALANAVVTEVTDENQALIRRTTSSALSSGALQTRTDLPGGSWRIVTSLGRADGSILRETVSGQ